MKSFIIGAAIFAAVAALFLVFYDHPFFTSRPETAEVAGQPAEQVSQPPLVKYPVPQPQPPAQTEAAVEPAPAGQESPAPPAEQDQTLEARLAGLIPQQNLFGLLQLDNLIQRFVVTVDSLPEKRVSQHHLPLSPPPGRFMVTGGSISPENAKRYRLYLQMIDTLGIERAVSLYVQYYDRFQAAYRDLGYPQGHFNDRFVTVIDHLLATPAADTPLQVVQPLLVYQYADPELEKLSAGQKLLLRIGAENRSRVEIILGELRQRLTTLAEAKPGQD